MRFKQHLELERGLKQIDIAPLINIVLLLLIFFILISGFVLQPGIKVNFSKAITGEALKYENTEIIVSSQNMSYLNGKIITNQELRNQLMPIARRKQPILIKADKNASLGRVVEIWNMCRDSGITQVNIATTQ